MSDSVRTLAVIAWLGAAALAPSPPTKAEGIEFKGYYKNLLIDSRTVSPLAEDYTLDLNRLRLEARGRPRGWLGFEVAYDNEALLGSFLETAEFEQWRVARPPTYWDLEDDYVNRGSLFVRHRLYRGYLDVATPIADVLIGRQRVAWGSGRFWNPTDLLNPFNPLAVEREERQGVDALLVQRNIAALSRLTFVYAPQRDAGASRAVHFRTNVADTDVVLMAGEFRRERVVGLDLVGRLGEGSMHLEAARTDPESGSDFVRAVAGVDYAFQNTLILTAEYYYNGEGTRDGDAYDFARLHAGLVQNVGRRYAGARAQFDLTPLLRLDSVLLVNLHDRSRFFAPSFTYSLTANLDWSSGVQLFSGANGSEYASFNNVYYTHLQYFF